MAYENVEIIPSMEAGEDLSAAQHRFGIINAAGQVVRNTTVGEDCDGVIQDDPDTIGYSVALGNQGISKVVAGAVVALGDKVMSDAVGRAITVVSPVATSATKTGGAATYNLDAGDTAVIDVDNAGNATSTWDAAAGTITDTTTYAVADQDTLTSIITVDGGDPQTVTFSVTTTTAAIVASEMNDQLVGASVTVAGGQVVISSDSQGTGSSVSAAAGTGALTWAGAVAGTGDVVDINAVTAAEVKTVIEADTTAEVDITTTPGYIIINSPTSGTTSELDFKSGNALTPLGLSVEVVIGSTGYSYYIGKALEAASAAGDLISILLKTGAQIY